MAWNAADRLAVAQSILSCFGEDYAITGRFLKFLFVLTNQNLVSSVQNAASTWAPFTSVGLSIPWWNGEVQRFYDLTEP